MKRVKFNVVDYVPKPINIDYSELVTEPHQVLSMREIYQRYVAMGVDPLKGELIDDDEDLEQSAIYDPDPDDELDMLHEIDVQRQLAKDKARSRSTQVKQHSASANDEHPEDADHSDEPKQSKRSEEREGEHE